MRQVALRSAFLSVLIALAVPAGTGAQGPAYSAQPPTSGALYTDGQAGRYLLGGQWLYKSDPGDQGEAAGWWQDTAATDGWTPVTVPNAYNAGDYSDASMAGQVGWYRRDFTVPASAFAPYVRAGGRHWIIRFESVNYRATVWLNGQQIGSHAGAYLPFEIDLNGLRPGVNRLVVRVDNRRQPSDLPPDPGSGWWNFGGILREVYLRAAQNADLAQVRVMPVLPCPSCSATIKEQALVRNVTASPQTVSLRGAYGGTPIDFGTARIAPHATWNAQASAVIAHPRLWTLGSPFLYRATLTLSDSLGRKLGGYVTDSGVRSITVHRGHLELNGRQLHLRGVATREQDLQLGAALDPAHMRQLMGWVKALGATVIREHFPLNPEIQEMADRDGVLIWSEIPVYHVSSHYIAQSDWLSRAYRMLSENIVTNGNHPSVLLWSIGNELAVPVDSAEANYIAGAAKLAHRLDPTRPVGMAGVGPPCDRGYNPLDVLGDNEYFGWFDANGGGTDDRDALGPFLDSFRKCWPNKALMVTEFGFDSNRHGSVDERGTYEFQSDAIRYHLGVFATKPWLSGAIYWTLQDFASWPGWAGGNPRGTPPFVQKGVVCGSLTYLCPGIEGMLKPAFSVLQSIYRSTQQIGPVPRR